MGRCDVHVGGGNGRSSTRWEVPELAAVTVVGGLPLPPLGEGSTPTEPDGVPLPIPVLREVC